MTPTEIRLNLRRAGFHPIPLRGKRPDMKSGWQWQALFNATPEQMDMWAKTWPDAINTGILCRNHPALDIDILHPEAAEAVEALVCDRFEERGHTPVRIGKAPKRAILFRTDEQIDKITCRLVGPDGTDQRIELLADGQQLAALGVHPETTKPYRWFGGEPGEIEAEDLAYLSAAEARQVVDDAAKLLVDQFGFTFAGSQKKTNGAEHPGTDGQDPTNWDTCIANVIDHDYLTAFASKLVNAGMHEGAAVNFLRAMLEHSSAPRDDRWRRRFSEIPGMVRSAGSKRGEEQRAEEPKFSSADEGSSFGYSWRLRWHGEAEVKDSRPWLVQDILPETGVGLISGQWGTFKTFVAIDLSAAVMTSTPFIRFSVRRKGGILFIASEGQNEVAIRVSAAAEARGLQKAPFAWVEASPRLLDPNAAKILTTMVKQASEKMLRDFGVSVVLVIVDTVGRAAGYTKSGDENDAATAKQVMKSLAAASKETGALFLAVAHFGKAIETGTRGSSSFEDDADLVLALLGDKSITGTVTNTRLCIRKRRNGVNGEEIAFGTKSVSMGQDEAGSELTTLTIDWLSQAEPTAKPQADKWSKSLRLLRQTLMTILVDAGRELRPFPDGPLVRAVDIELVRREFYVSHLADGTSEQQKAARQKAFKRAVRDAQERGLIGLRVADGVTLVWLANAQDGATQNA